MEWGHGELTNQILRMEISITLGSGLGNDSGNGLEIDSGICLGNGIWISSGNSSRKGLKIGSGNGSGIYLGNGLGILG